MHSKEVIGLSISLLVTATVAIYATYYSELKTIGELTVFIAPFLFFSIFGWIKQQRTRQTVKHAQAEGEDQVTIDLRLRTALIHDICTYTAPVIILMLPFIFRQTPNTTTAIQASVAFLFLTYVRFLYWKEL